MAEAKKTVKKKPSIKEITKPTKQTPVKEKQEEAQTVEEMKAELAALRKEKKERGGRPKKVKAERATIRVSFYITPTQEKALKELFDTEDGISPEVKDEILSMLEDKQDDDK